jgi:hypothetical protein
MQKALAIGVAAALLACTAPTGGPRRTKPPARPAVRTSGEDYRVPERIGEFELERLSDYAEAELGFHASYRGAQLANSKLDFFVYSARNLPSDLSMGDALWAIYEQTKREVELGNPRTGWGLALASESVKRTETPRGTVEGVLARYQGSTSESQAVQSFAYLAIVGTDLVKMRATHWGESSEGLEPALETAREDFLKRLEPRRKRPNPQTFTIDSQTDAQAIDPNNFRLPCRFLFETGYGAFLASLLGEGRFLYTLEREVEAREAALALVTQPKLAACDEPLVADLAELHGAGFARELIWLTAKPPYAAAPADLRLDDFKTFHRDRLGGRALLRRVPVTVQFGDDTTASGSEPTSAAGAAPAP